MSEQKTPVTEADLAQFDEDYEQSEVQEDGFEPIPDGKYQVVTEHVELTRSLKGDAMLRWVLKITGPNHPGRKLWRNNVLGGPENIAWLKKDLYACGVKLGKVSELPANLSRLLDLHLEVMKKTRHGDDGRAYESVYINKRLKTPEGGGGGGGNADRAGEALARF